MRRRAEGTGERGEGRGERTEGRRQKADGKERGKEKGEERGVLVCAMMYGCVSKKREWCMVSPCQEHLISWDLLLVALCEHFSVRPCACVPASASVPASLLHRLLLCMHLKVYQYPLSLLLLPPLPATLSSHPSYTFVPLALPTIHALNHAPFKT